MSELKDSSGEVKKKLCRKCRRRLQQNKEELVASTVANKASKASKGQGRIFTEWQSPLRDWLRPVTEWQRPMAEWQRPLLEW